MKTLKLNLIATGFLALTAFGAQPISAQTATMTTPAVGDAATDFELSAVNGELTGDVKLSDVTKDGPVVLVVLRGYPGYQCGMCSRQVNELVGKAKAFAAKDAKVLMVYPGPAADLEMRADEFVKGNKLPAPFTLLTDPDYKFTNAYGLRWNAPSETAYPSTFIIGTDGKIKMVEISKSHGGRTSSDQILAKL